VSEKDKKWLTTDNPAIIFEDNTVGRLKKQIWDATEEEIDEILREYEIPSESELGKAGTYIQNTPRYKVIEKRKKNDIVFVPVGCTENHGMHANSGLDTFMVTQILEGVRNIPDKLEERNDNNKRYKRMGPIYEIEFGGATSNKLARIGLSYNAELLSGIDPEKIGVYRTENTGNDSWKYVGGALDANNEMIYLRLKQPGLYTLMAYITTFEDIKNHWARNEIEKLAAKKVISGINDAQFEPDREITRAEFAKLLVSSLIINPYFNIRMTDSGVPLFADIPKDAWYRVYVDTAAWYGIVKGNDGKYRPDAPITREEMAVMIMRTLNLQEEIDHLAKNPGFYSAGKVPLDNVNFNDHDKISGWALGSVILAQQKGIIKGDNSGNFKPKSNATRAEAAVVILRAMKQQGILYEPVTITGKLTINQIEGTHYELIVQDGEEGKNTHYVVIPSDYILSMKLQAEVGNEISITGLLENEASIYMRGPVFKALSIGSKVELPCWRCSKEAD
jgi:hypothetical protein